MWYETYLHTHTHISSHTYTYTHQRIQLAYTSYADMCPATHTHQARLFLTGIVALYRICSTVLGHTHIKQDLLPDAYVSYDLGSYFACNICSQHLHMKATYMTRIDSFIHVHWHRQIHSYMRRYALCTCKETYTHQQKKNSSFFFEEEIKMQIRGKPWIYGWHNKQTHIFEGKMHIHVLHLT